MVGFFITWLLYNQNPSRSNMAQPYQLIVWILIDFLDFDPEK